MNRFAIISGAFGEGKHAVIGKSRSYLGLAGFIVACMFVQPSMASIVGTCKSGAQYATIQLAVNATPPGGTVNICPGAYPEQVVINKHLTLIGLTITGTDNAVITAPSGGVVQNTTDLYDGTTGIGAQVLIQGGVIVSMSNLAVDGTNNQISCGPNLVGIYYQNSSGTINHVIARNQALAPQPNGCQSGSGIFVQSGYTVPGTSNVTIENSSVHGYQKNGITADGNGTNVTISGNDVVGFGPTSGAAQNGIQVSDQAAGTVFNNTVVDDVYTGPTYAASGILVYDTGSITVQSNIVSDTQYGVVVVTDGAFDANDNTVLNNRISATHLDDGIDLCSDGNTAKGNTVVASDGSGIHSDSSCTDTGGNPTGNSNTITGNTVNEACAGVLLGNGSGNTTSPNKIYNVNDLTYAGDACPVGGGSVPKREAKALPQRIR